MEQFRQWSTANYQPSATDTYVANVSSNAVYYTPQLTAVVNIVYIPSNVVNMANTNQFMLTSSISTEQLILAQHAQQQQAAINLANQQQAQQLLTAQQQQPYLQQIAHPNPTNNNNNNKTIPSHRPLHQQPNPTYPVSTTPTQSIKDCQTRPDVANLRNHHQEHVQTAEVTPMVNLREPLAVISEDEEIQPEFMDHLKTDTDDEYQVANRSPSPPSSPSVSPVPFSLTGPKRNLFKPRYPARAQLNIFVPKELTNSLFETTREVQQFDFFPTVQSLYYYVNMTTAFQMNDRQIYVFELNGNKVGFVNCDLQSSEDQVLYGIITENTSHKRKDGKWEWQMTECLTEKQILEQFGVFGLQAENLPTSSRSFSRFQQQLHVQYAVSLGRSLPIIDDTDWQNVERIRNKNRKQHLDDGVVVTLNVNAFKRELKKSWLKSPTMPIVVNESKRKRKQTKEAVVQREKAEDTRTGHWIEWIKLVEVQAAANDVVGVEQKLFVAVSCRFNEETDQWRVTSICLDKGDILNKHRLCGLAAARERQYARCLAQFVTNIKDIQWV